MEEYRYIADINYNNKKYILLCNNFGFIFVMKRSNENFFKYPTFKEFEFFNNIFNAQEEKILLKISNSKENIIKGDKARFIPKIMYKGVLISLSAAIALCSCSKINEEESGINIKPVEQIYEMEDESSKDLFLEECTDKEFCEVYGLEVEETEKYFFKCNTTESINKSKINMCSTNKEFIKYLDNKNPTFDDLRKTLEKNNNISEENKNILYEGIDNLEKSKVQMNLSILNYNLSKLQIKEESVEKIQNNMGKNVVAYFNSHDSIAYISNSADSKQYKIALFHEVFGHGMTNACIGDSVIKGFSVNLVNVKGEALDRQIIQKNFGKGLSEGTADVLTMIALNDKEKYSIDISGYNEQIYQTLVLKELLDISYKYLIENGTYGIIEKMDNELVDSGLFYIVNMDASTKALQNNIEYEGLTMDENIKKLFVDYAKIKIKKGEDKDEVKKYLIKVLDKFPKLEATKIEIIREIDIMEINEEFEHEK